MAATAILRDIVEHMQKQSEERRGYYHRDTGTVTLVFDHVFSILEDEFDEDDLGYDPYSFHGVRPEEVEIARNIIDSDNYIALPTLWDIYEYEIMREFCDSLPDDKPSQMLRITMRGSGAFRRFKDSIFTLGLEEQWYRYQEEAYTRIAREWCREHHIPFRE